MSLEPQIQEKFEFYGIYLFSNPCVRYNKKENIQINNQIYMKQENKVRYKRNLISRQKPFSTVNSFKRLTHGFFIFSTLLLTCLLVLEARTQTVCPVETPPFGGAVLDGSSDEYETYIAITDDEYTRMTRLKYCKCCINGSGVHEHFRGFEVTLESPTTGQTYVQEFGTIDGTEADTFCEIFEMPEELMFLTVFADSNDVEGLIFEDYATTQFVARANGQLTSGRQQLGGRPIGFRVTMGRGGRDNQPLVMSVVYNDCNCPASTFIGNQTPVDMTIEAVVGAPQTQPVQYQDNYMRFVYQQNCGSYGVEITPNYPFMTEQTTGLNVDENGNAYLDQIQLTAGTLADVGRYPVAMRVFQDPNNPDHGYTFPYRGTVPEETYEFFITITPCQVNTYSVDQSMPDITYNLGDPAETAGTFSFVQDSDCGYTESISLQGLPSWVTYDATLREFTVPQTSDPSRVGQYTVTVDSELSIPTDYTQTTFLTKSAQVTFTIFVNPCIVTNYQNVPINDMQYIISEAQVFSDPAPLDFIQDPLCGYIPTVIVAAPGLPAFMTFDSINQRYTIPQNFDKSLHGTYFFTINSSINFFSDSSKTTTTTLTTSQTVQVDIIDPCRTTVLDPLFINDMDRFVKQSEFVQTYAPLQDSVSQNYGPQDGLTFCGNRICEIVSPPSPPISQYSPYLQFDANLRQFRVQTDDPGQIGNYNFEFRCYLENYPTNEQIATFNVDIYTCQLSTLTPTPVPLQRYNVYTPPISWSVAEFVQDPDCQHPLTYTYELFDATSATFSSLPAWISVVSERNFQVSTNDPLNMGLYTIAVTASVPLSLMTPEFKEILFIDLDVLNECEIDQVDPLSNIPYQLYYIAEDPVRSFSPTWTSAINGCPTFFDIEIDENGIWRPLNAAELAVISFNSADGSFSFQTSDYQLDGQIWLLNVFKKSTYSVVPSGKGEYIFDLEFRDICWDSTLTAAQFLLTAYTYDLWQAQDLRYSQMIDSSQGLACGGFTYQIEYMSGPVFDITNHPVAGADLTMYTTTTLSLFEIQMQTTQTDMAWVGIHTFRIKSTLGQADTSANARGNSGLYNSLYSQEMKLTILNPCTTSVVNGDLGLILGDLEVPSGQTLLTQDFDGPTNSASVTYGNGYDKCGPLVYEISDQNGDPYSNTFFDQLFGGVPNAADINQFKLASAPVGTSLSSFFILKVSLLDYPFATKATFPINLKYRECFPNQLARKMDDQTVQVGDVTPTSVDYFFDQFPCSYTQSYKVEILDSKTRDVLVQPDFITTEDLLITFKDQTDSDVGKYIVKITSMIENSLSTEVSSEFLLTVKAADDVVIGVNVTPDFLVNLQDQRVKVGQSLVYTPGLKSNTYGFTMTVQVILGDAFRFATYDLVGNIFRVAGSETVRSDVGTYDIFVTATFQNSTYEERYERTFRLTIWDDPLPPDPLPNDVIYYEEWTMPIVDDVEPWEPDTIPDPERPIPYVADMTSTGMLVIGWDRKMNPPNNITVIPPTKIAHKDYKNIDAYRFTPFQQSSSSSYQESNRRNLQSQQQYVGPVVGNKFSNLGKEDNEDNLVWFANRTDLLAERMALLDALELRIKSQNAMPEDKLVEFTWDIMGYDTDFIWLQIYIQNPWEVSQDGQYDTISVTFWGVDFFRSKQGKEVMYGTTLYQSIFRQLDVQEAQNVDNTDQRGWFLASILLISPFVLVGSLLPTWMFINSLQLIAHMPLLNSQMPGNAHYFLNKYLDLVRWHNSDLQLWFDSNFNFKKYALDEGLYHKFLQACGYEHLYAQNLILVIAAVLLITLVWIIIQVKDFIASRRPFQKRRLNKRDEPMVTNFALRFFYEFFLEFAICITLNLSIVDFAEFSPSFQFTSSVLVILAIVAIVAFVGSLLCKRGPYAQNFYQPGTAAYSLWGARHMNPDFDEAKFFKKNPPHKIKPWGSFIMRIDLEKVESIWNKIRCRSKNQSQVSASDFDDSKKQLPKDRKSPINRTPQKEIQTPQNDHINQLGVENQLTLPTERKLLESDRDYALPQIEDQNTRQGDEIQSDSFRSETNSQQSGSYVSSSERSSSENSEENSGSHSSYESQSQSQSQSSVSNESQSQKSRDRVDRNMQRDPQEEMYEGGSRLNYADDIQTDQYQNTERAFNATSNSKSWAFSNGTDTQSDSKKSSQRSSDDQETDQKRKKSWNVKRQAKLAIEIEESLRKPQRYKTLYYGLKVNHPRNVAVIHPLMFFLRRIILACIIVFLDEIPLVGTWIFMACSLTMLAYVLTEQQWSDKIITNQHIVDEMTIYVLSVLLLCYTNFVSAEMRYILGFILIGIVFAFVIYNTIIMLVFALRIALMYLRRIYVMIIRNKLSKESKHISAKIRQETQGWRGPLYDKKVKEKDFFMADDLEQAEKIQYRFETLATTLGGQQGRLYAIRKDNPNDISVIMQICDYIDQPQRKRSSQNLSGLISRQNIESESDMVEEKSSGDFFCPDDVSEDSRLKLENLKIQEIVEEVDTYGNTLGKRIINEKDYILKKDEDFELEVNEERDREIIRRATIVDHQKISPKKSINEDVKVNQIGLSDFVIDEAQKDAKKDDQKCDIKRETNYSNQFGESQFSQVRGQVVNENSTDLSIIEQNQRRMQRDHQNSGHILLSSRQDYDVSSVQNLEQSDQIGGGYHSKKNRLTSAQSQNTIIEVKNNSHRGESVSYLAQQEKYMRQKEKITDQPMIEEEGEFFEHNERIEPRKRTIADIESSQFQQVQDIAPPSTSNLLHMQDHNHSALSTVRQSLPGQEINLNQEVQDGSLENDNSQSTIHHRYQSMMNESTRLTPLNFNQNSKNQIGIQEKSIERHESFVNAFSPHMVENRKFKESQVISNRIKPFDGDKKLDIQRHQPYNIERLSQSMIPQPGEFQKMLQDISGGQITPRPEESSQMVQPLRSTSKETIKRDSRHNSTMLQNGQGIMIGSFQNNQADLRRQTQIHPVTANSRQVIRNVSGPLNQHLIEERVFREQEFGPQDSNTYRQGQPQFYDLSKKRLKRVGTQAVPPMNSNNGRIQPHNHGLQDDQYSILDNNFVQSSQISQIPTPLNQHSVERKPKKHTPISQTHKMTYSHFQPPAQISEQVRYSLTGAYTSPNKLDRRQKTTDKPMTDFKRTDERIGNDLQSTQHTQVRNQTVFKTKKGSTTPQTENISKLISHRQTTNNADLYQEQRQSAEPKTWRNVIPQKLTQQTAPVTPNEHQNPIMRVFNINVQNEQEQPIEDWPHELRNGADLSNKLTPSGNKFLRGQTIKAKPQLHIPDGLQQHTEANSISPRLNRNLTVRLDPQSTSSLHQNQPHSNQQFGGTESNSASFIVNRDSRHQSSSGNYHLPQTQVQKTSYEPASGQQYLQISSSLNNDRKRQQRESNSQKPSACKRGRTLERNQTVRVSKHNVADPFQQMNEDEYGKSEFGHNQERRVSVEHQTRRSSNDMDYGVFALQKVNNLATQKVENKSSVYPFGKESQQITNKNINYQRRKF